MSKRVWLAAANLALCDTFGHEPRVAMVMGVGETEWYAQQVCGRCDAELSTARRVMHGQSRR